MPADHQHEAIRTICKLLGAHPPGVRGREFRRLCDFIVEHPHSHTGEVFAELFSNAQHLSQTERATLFRHAADCANTLHIQNRQAYIQPLVDAFKSLSRYQSGPALQSVVRALGRVTREDPELAEPIAAQSLALVPQLKGYKTEIYAPSVLTLLTDLAENPRIPEVTRLVGLCIPEDVSIEEKQNVFDRFVDHALQLRQHTSADIDVALLEGCLGLRYAPVSCIQAIRETELLINQHRRLRGEPTLLTQFPHLYRLHRGSVELSPLALLDNSTGLNNLIGENPPIRRDFLNLERLGTQRNTSYAN